MANDDAEEESVFYQLQNVFGHLLESRLKYYEADKFWRCFRLYGDHINPKKQEDAFDFFIQLVDQVDEYLCQRLKRPKIFSSRFEGVFSDQKICQGCPHRYDREEAFMALNLTVKSNNLQDSLDQFVKGELLEGDNAYFCEKCKVKRNTIKRLCIRTLPSTLVIQLKRFDYDWVADRALKFDNFFKFPWLLDMSPYTSEGIKASERSPKSSRRMSFGRLDQRKVGECFYELVGIVVHSGQASAGHYYSYIKDRGSGRWFKFNDTTVEAFDMTDASLASECFGGNYEVKATKANQGLPEKRLRYWNAYILFYEAVQARTTVAPRTRTVSQSQMRPWKPGSSSGILAGGASVGTGMDGPNSVPTRTSEPTVAAAKTARAARESLSQLSDLLEKGEQRGLFSSRMPASVERGVQEENLRFLENRDVFSQEYYNFVADLLQCCTGGGGGGTRSRTGMGKRGEGETERELQCENAVRLAVSFLCNTYFHVRERQSGVISDTVDAVSALVDGSPRAGRALMSILSDGDGLRYLKPFLLECPAREVRANFAHLLSIGFRAAENDSSDTEDRKVHRVLSSLVELMESDAATHCKNSGQFFWLLSKFAQMVIMKMIIFYTVHVSPYTFLFRFKQLYSLLHGFFYPFLSLFNNSRGPPNAASYLS